jgi:hypothetical protein
MLSAQHVRVTANTVGWLAVDLPQGNRHTNMQCCRPEYRQRLPLQLHNTFSTSKHRLPYYAFWAHHALNESITGKSLNPLWPPVLILRIPNVYDEKRCTGLKFELSRECNFVSCQSKVTHVLHTIQIECHLAVQKRLKFHALWINRIVCRKPAPFHNGRESYSMMLHCYILHLRIKNCPFFLTSSLLTAYI